MPIYRIRQYVGYEGRSNFLFHADVITRSPASAIKAARENRIRNWRWIDTYDTTNQTYRWYELIGRISESYAKKPAKPLTLHELEEERRWIEKIRRKTTKEKQNRYVAKGRND